MKPTLFAFVLLAFGFACDSSRVISTKPVDAGPVPDRNPNPGSFTLPSGEDAAGSFTPNMPAPRDASTGPDVDTTWGTHEAFCANNGPMILVGDTTGQSDPHSVCMGQVAAASFQNALCTCQDARLGGYLLTQAFDSGKGGTPNDARSGGASVGINRDYTLGAGYNDIGGSWAIAGSKSLQMVGYVQVRGDFRAAGEVTIPGYTKIARDAWLGGSFRGLGPVSIGRDLHRQGQAFGFPSFNVEGQTIVGPVSVESPCACQNLLDVGALVNRVKTRNDNAKVGLANSAFNRLAGNETFTLPCGRFYFESINVLGEVKIAVQGRVSLFIEGNVTSTGKLEFDLAPNAELDLFIKGNLVLTGRAYFGDKLRPAGTRIYVGGDGDIVLVGDMGFVGNLYAPHSLVTAIGYANVFGSVFAKDFQSPGHAKFVFDLAITRQGDDCNLPPPLTCTRCGICTGGTACVNGTCGACQVDTDCCGLSICNKGVCGPLIL